MAPVSASAFLPARTLSCFSARAYSPAKQSSSKRKTRCGVSAGCSRKCAVSHLSASRTLPAANSSLAVTGTVSLLARGLPRLELEYVEALVDKALQRAILFRVVADLNLAESEADRFHRVFCGPGKLDGCDQTILHVNLEVILLIVPHRLVVDDVDLFQVISGATIVKQQG